MNPPITCHDVWLTEILLKMVLNTYTTYPDLEDNHVRQRMQKGDEYNQILPGLQGIKTHLIFFIISF
jgi:hypothetical protein